MIRSLARRVLLPLVLGASLLVPSLTHAAKAPSIHLSAKSIGIMKTAVVTGAHLPPKTYLIILLAVPNSVKPKYQSFLNTGKTDKNGNIKVTVRIPIEPYCGSAGIYVLNSQHKLAKMVGTSIKITGCKASSKPGKLPPPPSSPPKKKKP